MHAPWHGCVRVLVAWLGRIVPGSVLHEFGTTYAFARGLAARMLVPWLVRTCPVRCYMGPYQHMHTPCHGCACTLVPWLVRLCLARCYVGLEQHMHTPCHAGACKLVPWHGFACTLVPSLVRMCVPRAMLQEFETTYVCARTWYCACAMAPSYVPGAMLHEFGTTYFVHGGRYASWWCYLPFACYSLSHCGLSSGMWSGGVPLAAVTVIRHLSGFGFVRLGGLPVPVQLTVERRSCHRSI